MPPILFGDSNYLISRNRVENLLKPQRHHWLWCADTPRWHIKTSGVSDIRSLQNMDSSWFYSLERLRLLKVDTLQCKTWWRACAGWRWRSTGKGVNGTWLGEALSRRESDFSKSTMHVTYQTGKGRTHMVPVLFPNDMLKALAILAMPDIREACGVHPSNNFCPVTQLSQGHVNGWNATHSSCKMAGVKQPGRLTATTMRHRVSTKYAALKDVPEHERHLFYNHMGHSAEMNKNVYQHHWPKLK